MKQVVEILLDDSLLRDADAVAGQKSVTISALVEEALREKLARTAAVDPGVPADTRPFLVFPKPAGLKPGVDLNSNSALHDVMDGLHGTS